MREDTERLVKDAKTSAAADKAKGHTKEVIGTIKEKVGRAIGDDELEAKGYAQNAEGKVDRAKGEIKEKVEDVKNKVKAGAEVVKEKIDQLRDSSKVPPR
jgi:uncharacterized protein YjbJ (UPF0337 family)